MEKRKKLNKIIFRKKILVDMKLPDPIQETGEGHGALNPLH